MQWCQLPCLPPPPVVLGLHNWKGKRAQYPGLKPGEQSACQQKKSSSTQNTLYTTFSLCDSKRRKYTQLLLQLRSIESICATVNACETFCPYVLYMRGFSSLLPPLRGASRRVTLTVKVMSRAVMSVTLEMWRKTARVFLERGLRKWLISNVQEAPENKSLWGNQEVGKC